eukprot:354064-Chlamydomonas_euryale.AAC.11
MQTGRLEHAAMRPDAHAPTLAFLSSGCRAAAVMLAAGSAAAPALIAVTAPWQTHVAAALTVVTAPWQRNAAAAASTVVTAPWQRHAAAVPAAGGPAVAAEGAAALAWRAAE